ncbi:MATE family efflux transporter [Fictibacillus sp. NRS-1165]
MKPMLLFLVPLFFSNIMQSIGQVAGMFIIGRWLGVDSVAAISAFFPLFFLLISFMIGIGSGSSTSGGNCGYGSQSVDDHAV